MMAELSLQSALLLLLLAAAVAVATKFVRLPYTIALVIVGTAIGASGIFPPFRLSKELLLGVLLPPILFEGALYMDLEALRRNWRSIGALAGVGTLISAILIGVGAHYLLQLDWSVAFLLGVIISPTDPASVLALFRKLRLERLTTIIEGESVFNDGLAVVLFGLISATVAGAGATPLETVGRFFQVVFIGMLVGFGFGYLVFRLLAHIDDYLIEGVITLILAYGSFIIAEALGGSGVIAVVLAGLIIGNYGRALSMSPTTRLHLTSFWEFGSFMANSLLFLLIGLGLAQVELALQPAFLSIFATIGLLLLSRAAAVYPLCGLLNITGEKIPLKWQHLILWGGLRGSIPIALVLGLHGVVSPEVDNLLLTTVFGVVAFSLIVQGLSIGPLVRWLGLSCARSPEVEELLAREGTWRAALNELEKLSSRGELSQRTLAVLRAEYEEKLKESQEQLAELAEPEVLEDERRYAARRALHAARAALRLTLERGIISEGVYRKLAHEIDQELRELR